MRKVVNIGNAFWLLFVLLNLTYAENSDQLIFSTKECHLEVPVFGHKFNFSALNIEFSHVVNSSVGDRFEFNICGNLTKTCNGQQNVAGCFYRDNKEYILGTQMELNFKLGTMFFSFSNGSKCPFSNKDEPFQLQVFMGCDYSLDKNQLSVTAYDKDACSFHITYETAYACLPEPPQSVSSPCSVEDPKTGKVYNLFPLSDENYRILDLKGSEFVMNICKPVLYGQDAMCPANSSVCYISQRATNIKYKYLDYGSVQANPVIENGRLLMRLPSQTRCNKTHNFESVIQFDCDMSEKNGRPELIGNHGCLYEFSFSTSLACGYLDACTAVINGKQILDMSPLKNRPFTLNIENKSYTFSVCSAAGSPCSEKDGACMTENKQTTSLGAINTTLSFNQSGTPFLLYEGGDTCQKLNDDAPSNLDTSSVMKPTTVSNWSTKIEFVCVYNASKDNNVAGPKIIENSNCQLLIHYVTELACYKQIQCKVRVYSDDPQDGKGVQMLDLTPLISATENYEAQVDATLIGTNEIQKDTKFFLNVCRPLVPKFGLNCPGGSAACMATVNDNFDTAQNEKTMGYLFTSLEAINGTTAKLSYRNGAVCPTDKNSKMSTGIIFYCDMRAGRGIPILRKISDCHYQFDWATNVICPPHMCVFDSNSCELVNDDINARFNLRQATFTDQGKLTVEKNNKKINLDLCAVQPKAVTDYSQFLVNLYFEVSGLCKTQDVMNVQIRLVCSSETKSPRTFVDEKQCNLVYTLHTTEICDFLLHNNSNVPTMLPTMEIPGIKQDSHPAEHISYIGVILAVILTLVFFLGCLGAVFWSPQRRHACRRLFQRSNSTVLYSSVRSNEEANLLLEPNGEFTDSDDDMLL